MATKLKKFKKELLVCAAILYTLMMSYVYATEVKPLAEVQITTIETVATNHAHEVLESPMLPGRVLSCDHGNEAFNNWSADQDIEGTPKDNWVFCTVDKVKPWNRFLTFQIRKWDNDIHVANIPILVPGQLRLMCNVDHGCKTAPVG